MRSHRSRSPRPGLVGMSILLLVLAAACGDDEDAGSDSQDPPPPGTVRVDDNVFEPETLDVETGDTVTWEWVGDQPHNVVHDDFEIEIQTGGVFEHTLDEPGTYDYVCTVHPGMEGTINVTD